MQALGRELRFGMLRPLSGRKDKWERGTMKRLGILAAAAVAVMTFTAPAKAGETLDAIKAV